MIRRKMAHLGAWLAAILSLAAMATSANAAAPMVTTAQPGYYRMMLGDFEVTALSDGTVKLPFTELLTNTTAARIRAALARAYLKDPVETSVNAYLINTGSKLIMIDAGAGKLFGPTLGKLLTSMQAAGYRPDQVDEIYITHLHADHVGGLAADGKTVFPNAIVRVEQKDADFWLSKANLDKASDADKPFFQGAMLSVDPYVAAGRFKPFAGNTELVPGIRAVVTRGHTPGHTVYMIESKDQKLVLWGDLMHNAAVQFPEPAVTIKFDTDSKTAAAKRKAEFAAAAKGGYWVGAAHLPFPGIGHLRADGKGYDWVPANFSEPR